MRVYISVDMAGVVGISHARPTARGDAGYPEAVAGFDRAGDRGISYSADDPVTLYRAFLSAVRLAGTADD